MLIDLDQTMTQTEFGALVGISQPAVSALIARRVLSDGASARQWLQEYCRNLREIASGRAAEGSIELATERALLAREQRERIAMQNAVTRRELAPRGLLAQVLAATAPRVCGQLDAIVPALRKRGNYSSADLTFVSETIANVRNAIAKIRLVDVIEDLEQEASAAGDDDVIEREGE